MGNIYHSISELIGHTPLLEVHRLEEKEALKARLLVKIELFNPTGSIKDRTAGQMIADAKKEGRLRAGAVIIEPTSGNMGIGLAALGAAKGYRTIFTMPDTMSMERRKLLESYGAEIVLTDGKSGMEGAVRKAEELAASVEGAVLLGQFTNQSNPEAHRCTTGPEIWEDTDGEIDLLVAGVGTGGTVTGTGQYLKKKNPQIRVLAVEPAASPVLSGGAAGAHGIQGIGAGFIPDVLDRDSYDAVAKVQEEEAYRAVTLLARTEGILAGISSGAVLHAAMKEAAKEAYAGKTIVAVLPDTGERYLSASASMGRQHC